MLSGVQEKKMRLVRALLTFGWLVLIVSLFWDPITPELTRPDNVASPFHLKGKVVEVQGQALPEEPYQMTNRIFWTMIIPILPLFFMVAGHETWRRICPLSFVSQIPRYLGLNRKRPVFIRRTGQVENQLALVGKESWWRRNVWYIQFGLLFLALNARILFVNSDRLSLALFFIAVIIIALTVGYLWGGKTWCNYICPIAIVQKIYTEPRGLLESQSHIARQPISQSMCRTSSAEGDRSICVGCTPSCPDIDLERSYWDNITDPALRHVYYAFYGLIVGFYSFYYFYSGGWEYYFSGAWTHEANVVGDLFKPGLYINGAAIGIPKVVSSFLVLGGFVLAAVALGTLLEKLYRGFVARAKLPLSEPEIINRCLSFSAFVSINTFYLFGGRPNLMLLPTPALRMVDILIVALSTLWFLQAIQRNPTLYRREGLASSLMEQLRKLKVDISKFLEGRKLEELKPDEVYILAKTLPGFSKEQRLLAYRNILEDALRTGKADSAASLELLREVRLEIDVSDDEHRLILDELGIDGAEMMLDSDRAATYDDWIRIDSYRRAIEPMLLGRLDQGRKLEDVLTDPEVVEAIRKYREIYQVSEPEHDKVAAEVTSSGGLLFEKARHQANLLADNAALLFGLRARMLSDPQWLAIGGLLEASVLRRARLISQKLFSVLLTLGNTPETRDLCTRVAVLAGEDIEAALSSPVSSGGRVTWADTLDAALARLLRGGPREEDASGTGADYRAVIQQGGDLAGNLKQMAQAEDPLVGALALTAISYLDLGLARQMAAELERQEGKRHWLMGEVIDGLMGKPVGVGAAASSHVFSLTTACVNRGRQTQSFAKDYVTIGRSPDNDIAILSQSVSPYHLALTRESGHVQLRLVDPFAVVYLDGERVEGDRAEIQSGARITFLPPDQPGSLVVAEWASGSQDYSLEGLDTVSKLLWLSRANIFRDLDLGALAEIAAAAEIRRYGAGAWLCRAGDPSSDAFLLQKGEADVLVDKEGQEIRVRTLTDGALIGELGVITGKPRTASIRISSSAARILTINGERLRWLMERDASVSMNMLSVVSTYIKN